MILTDPDSGALVLTPTYHVFEMNVGHHDATSLAVYLDAPTARRSVGAQELETLSISASTKDDSALVSITNLDAEAATSVVLDLRGRAVTGHEARILTAPNLQAHNTPEASAVVAPTGHEGVRAHERGLIVDVPAHSYVTVRLQLA